MAARAASPPSFIGLSSSFEACHWLVRKQKPTNQRNAQKAGMDHHQHAKGDGERHEEGMCEQDIKTSHFSVRFNPARPTSVLQTGPNSDCAACLLAGLLTAKLSRLTIGVCRKYLRRVHLLVFGLITGLAFGLGREPEGLPVQERSPGLSATATASQPCPARTSEEQFLPRDLQKSGKQLACSCAETGLCSGQHGLRDATEER